MTTLTSFWEYPEKTLKDDLAKIVGKQGGADPDELYLIALSVLEGLKYLESQQGSVSDLRPELIGHTKDRIVLCDKLINDMPLMNCQKNNMMAKKPLYCCPEVFNAVKAN
jgi:hypothetical protein